MENLNTGLIDEVISSMEDQRKSGSCMNTFYAIGYLGAAVKDDSCVTVPLCDVVKLLRFVEENRTRF